MGIGNSSPSGVQCFMPGKGVIATGKQQHSSLDSNSWKMTNVPQARAMQHRRSITVSYRTPYKITVPVMAVEMQKSLVGIIWNPLDAWDGENQMLSAIFASPNWHQHQKNHALGVFLPTIPAWVQENYTEASIPYPLMPDRPVSIKTEIIVDGNASILDAVAHWTDAYGTPEPLQPPRSDGRRSSTFTARIYAHDLGRRYPKIPTLCGLGSHTTNRVSGPCSGTTISLRKMNK